MLNIEKQINGSEATVRLEGRLDAGQHEADQCQGRCQRDL